MPTQSLVTVPAPVPLFDTVSLNSLRRPACTTVTGTPPTNTTPLRASWPMLIATSRTTLPASRPEPLLLTVIHSALLSTRHSQPSPALTASEYVPAACAACTAAGVTLYEHVDAGSDTVFVNTPPPSVPANRCDGVPGSIASEVTTWLERPSFNGCQ